MEQLDGSALRYRLRFVHFWFFNCIHQFHSIVAQGFNGLCALGVGVIGWMTDETVVSLVWHAVAGYCALWMLQWLFNAAYLCSRPNRVLTEHVVQPSPQGLTDWTQTYETLNRWPGVTRVRDYPCIVAVYVGPFEAVVIPRSSFANAQARASWVAQVRQYLK